MELKRVPAISVCEWCGGTGWELIEACRADPATRHLPLIVVSAFYDQKAVKRADVQGFAYSPVFTVDLGKLGK